MRTFLGILASIPFIFVIPGMIVVLAFARTYFDYNNFTQNVVPDSYNSATLLLSEHFSGQNREVTSVTVDRLRVLISPTEYTSLLKNFFAIAQKAVNEVAGPGDQITLDLTPLKVELMGLADKAKERVQFCSPLETQKAATAFCIPPEISGEDAKVKFATTLSAIVQKQVPATYSFTITPPEQITSEQELKTQNDFEQIRLQMKSFAVNAYEVHKGIAISLFAAIVFYALLQFMIQFSFARALYFVGGIMIVDALMVKMIAKNASELPSIFALQLQFTYAQEHLMRFIIGEPLPLLAKMGTIILFCGAVIVLCGVLYSRQKKVRGTEVTV